MRFGVFGRSAAEKPDQGPFLLLSFRNDRPRHSAANEAKKFTSSYVEHGDSLRWACCNVTLLTNSRRLGRSALCH